MSDCALFFVLKEMDQGRFGQIRSQWLVKSSYSRGKEKKLQEMFGEIYQKNTPFEGRIR